MRILFDSQSENFKKPFGVLTPNQMCSLTIQIPSDCMAVSVSLRVKSENGFEMTVPFHLYKKENLYDIYRTGFSLFKTGLYFYWFEIASIHERFSLYKFGQHDTNIEAGDKWQLSCVPVQSGDLASFDGAVMYQIFPDRFYKSGECDLSEKLTPFTVHESFSDTPGYLPDSRGEVLCNDFFGGNLRGISEKLSYIKNLGVSVIYLNPIFMAFSNHRYDTADYMRIDPMLGTEEDFKELCSKAHSMGIKIILDGVFSHTGSNSVYFDIKKQHGGACCGEKSPYYSWYSFKQFPDKYSAWWGIKTLPCVNELNSSYMDYIIYNSDSVIAHWLGCGADGFRLDVADELPDEFIAALKKRVYKLKKDAIVIGEVWEDASNKISYGVRRKYFTSRELDSVMNYPFRTTIIDFILGRDDGSRLGDTVMSIAENYPQYVLNRLMNILSTHDTPRILTALGDNFSGDKSEKADRFLSGEQLEQAIRRLKAAAFLQFTLPGMPCIYYGDEAGSEGFEDPFCRRFFPWGKESSELQEFYRSLAYLKNTANALKSGNIRFTKAENGVLIFEREAECRRIISIINVSPNPFEYSSTAKPLFLCGDYASPRIRLGQYGFACLLDQ